MIRKIIILIIMLSIVNNANAVDSGSIEITQIYTKANYDFLAGGVLCSLSVNGLKTIYYDSTDFSHIDNFRLDLTDVYVSAYGSNSSAFTITSGGSGSGYVWYDRITDPTKLKLYYVFDSSSIFTSSPIVITPSVNIFNDISAIGGATGFCVNEALTTTKPVAPFSGDVTKPRIHVPHEDVHVSVRTLNNYTVAYINNSEGFILNIDKQTIATKIRAYNVLNNNYFSESSANTNDVINYLNNSNRGLIVNISLASGFSVVRIINNTYPSITTDDYSITFNKTSYNLNDDIEFNTNISNFDILDNYYILFSQEVISNTVYTQNFPIVSSDTVTFPSIDKTKISFVYAQLFKNGVSVLTSSAIPYGMNQNITDITGNITIDKSQYGLGENINIKYNTSVSGRIIVQCQNILNSENVYSGINQQTNYTISNLELFPCQIKLQYYYSTINDWITLDYKIFETIESIDNIFFSRSYASLGDTINVYYNTMGDREISLKDSQNNVKFNYTVPLSQYGLFKQYTLISTDLTGNYTAFLNYTNGTTITTATIKIMDAIVIIPTHTANVTYSLFDLFSDGTKAIVGDIDLDGNGDISDNEIKKKGDKAYYIFIFLALVILVSGTWNKVIRRK